jgi:hypothetical protein
MKAYQSFQGGNVRNFIGVERRQKPRIYDPIPIKVRGLESGGRRFEFDTVADDFGPGGFSARASQRCLPGQKLFFIIQFCLARNMELQAPMLAAHGNVLRINEQQDGSYKFAAGLSHYRFL